PVPAALPERLESGKGILTVVMLLLVAAAGLVAWRYKDVLLPSAGPKVATAPVPVPPPEEAPKPPTPPSVIPPKEPAPDLGAFALKIAVHPFAQVVSLSRDGEALRLDQTTTPLLIPELRVGSYELQLRHPQLGSR